MEIRYHPRPPARNRYAVTRYVQDIRLNSGGPFLLSTNDEQHTSTISRRSFEFKSQVFGRIIHPKGMELQTMAPGDEHDTNLDLLTLLIRFICMTYMHIWNEEWMLRVFPTLPRH